MPKGKQLRLSQQRIPRRVVKLGGSLLDWPGLKDRLSGWLASGPACQTLLVVGGGRLADAIRHADQVHGLGEAEAHWLAVQAMQVNAAMVRALLKVPWVRRVRHWAAQPARAGVWLLDPWSFLRREEPNGPGQPLPHTWHVTSDSIAARLSEMLNVPLVLLKSAAPPAPHTPAALAKCQFVDAYFPQAALHVRQIVCVDLRGETTVALHAG